MNPAIQVSNSIVTALAAGTFSQSFTPKRSYVPRTDLTSLEPGVVNVLVVGKEVSQVVVSRAQIEYTVKVDVGIQKKVPNLNQATIDAMMNLVDEVVTFLDTQDYTPFQWTETANTPIYAPDKLHEEKEFISVITLTFVGMVAR